MEIIVETKNETYYQKNRKHLNEQRLLEYHSKGLDKTFIKNYIKLHGQTATLNMVRDAKKQAKTAEFRKIANKLLIDSIQLPYQNPN
jgi:uncharacterized protein (DUF305 family)